MVTIKTILFPTDFSLRALHGYCYCLQLAKKLGASVHVLHVYSIDIGVPVTDAIAYKMVDERKKNTQHMLGNFAYLKKTQQASLTEGVDIHIHAAAGAAEDEIVAFAQENNIDLIIMPTKGEHNVLEILFGSVTTAVGSTTTCPLLILPEKASYQPIEDIVYTTDFSVANREHAAMPIALAQFFDAKLHFLHVYRDREPDTQIVATLLDSIPDGMLVQYEALQGKSVQKAIQTYLQTREIDILVAYSPPKNFFERLFRISTTRHLLGQVRSPLMILR